MPTLADVQRRIRDALVTGGDAGLDALLRGGAAPARRLAIHQRHYRATLVSSLMTRFPATAWLVGSDVVAAAAEAFVTRQPPTRPCVAEYGEAFPAFLGSWPLARPVPYLEPFAQLEWHVARLSVAVDRPPLSLADLDAYGPHALATASVSLQPVHYVALDWSLDDLFACYLADDQPEQFALSAGPVFVEVRGARGAVAMHRLGAGDFAFRAAVASGAALADAIARGGAAQTPFDAQQSLVTFIASGLVVAIHPAVAPQR